MNKTTVCNGFNFTNKVINTVLFTNKTRVTFKCLQERLQGIRSTMIVRKNLKETVLKIDVTDG